MFKFDVSNASGGISFSITSNDVLEAFCVDIDTYPDIQNFVYYALLGAGDYHRGAGKVDQIGCLYTGYEASVIDDRSSAAFQLALWEIFNEDSGSLNLYTDGTFRSNEFNSGPAGTGYLRSYFPQGFLARGRLTKTVQT